MPISSRKRWGGSWVAVMGIGTGCQLGQDAWEHLLSAEGQGAAAGAGGGGNNTLGVFAGQSP